MNLQEFIEQVYKIALKKKIDRNFQLNPIALKPV